MIRNCILARNGSTDWSLLELSILEQARKTLEYRGGHVETECGITDEGDPWLVFCDAQGAVGATVDRSTEDPADRQSGPPVRWRGN